MILNGIYFLDSIIPRWWKKSDNNFGPQSSWYNLMPDQKWKWSCIRKINFSATLEQLKCPTVAKDENWRAKKANLFKEAFRPSFKSLARSFCSLGHWGVYFENENREICKNNRLFKRYKSYLHPPRFHFPLDWNASPSHISTNCRKVQMNLSKQNEWITQMTTKEHQVLMNICINLRVCTWYMLFLSIFGFHFRDIY